MRNKLLINQWDIGVQKHVFEPYFTFLSCTELRFYKYQALFPIKSN